VNFQYERQRNLLQPDGSAVPLTYADGTPVIAREARGRCGVPVDAGNDYLTQPNSRSYLRVRKAEAILRSTRSRGADLQLDTDGRMNPKLSCGSAQAPHRH